MLGCFGSRRRYARDGIKAKFSARVTELMSGHATLQPVPASLLQAREALRREFAALHRRVLAIVREDAVCRRVLMTAPGVGAVVAITFKSAVDDPGRFAP